MNEIVDPLPMIIQAPRLFAGQIQFGDVTQSASAFDQVQGSLSFFRSVYDAFAGYRAAIIRLHGLVAANEEARALPSIDRGAEHRRLGRARRTSRCARRRATS